jgi:hypothetical protein
MHNDERQQRGEYGSDQQPSDGTERPGRCALLILFSAIQENQIGRNPVRFASFVPLALSNRIGCGS